MAEVSEAEAFRQAVDAWEDVYRTDKVWGSTRAVGAVCSVCSAVVFDRHDHARWHASMQVELLVLEGADSLMPS